VGGEQHYESRFTRFYEGSWLPKKFGYDKRRAHFSSLILIVFDIDATAEGRAPDFKLIAQLAVECRMPLCYGGDIKTVDQAKRIIGLGVEKVAISSAALEDPRLVSMIAQEIGGQSVVVVPDVRKRLTGSEYEAWTHNGRRNTGRCPVAVAQEAESLGAGEIVINSIEKDGKMKGYDLTLARRFREAIHLPMTMLGGAEALSDIRDLFRTCGVVGRPRSLFVFKGVYRAVLINYPSAPQKDEIIRSTLSRLVVLTAAFMRFFETGPCSAIMYY
jgi:imidazole glycerol-phosphate synthase subunit HisF